MRTGTVVDVHRAKSLNYCHQLAVKRPWSFEAVSVSLSDLYFTETEAQLVLASKLTEEMGRLSTLYTAALFAAAKAGTCPAPPLNQ